MAVLLQPAFVLHRRPYRETSLILELFTQDYGRIAVVARGIRKARSRSAAVLQPFVPLLVSFRGKGELQNLSQVEAAFGQQVLSGKNLRCGLYVNELVMRLLPKQDPHARLFAVYRKTLAGLQEAVCEQVLRLFEKSLLLEIGYGLPRFEEQKFKDEEHYRFHTDYGFLPCSAGEAKSAIMGQAGVFSGKTVNALLREEFDDGLCLQEVKRLMRFVLAALLGRPVESRSLFEYQLEMDK